MSRLHFPPAALLLEAAQAAGLDVGARDARLERARAGPGHWVSALALRAARGDQGAAARAAAGVASRAPGVLAAGDRGLLVVTAPDLRDLALGPGPRWAEELPVAPPRAPVPARRLGDPWYRALLACSRLHLASAPGRGHETVPPQVLLAAADAGRVADRVRLEQRPHHLVDWVVTTGAAVITWTQSRDAGAADPEVVAALRDQLASALRACGLTPVERI